MAAPTIEFGNSVVSVGRMGMARVGDILFVYLLVLLDIGQSPISAIIQDLANGT